MDMRTSARRAIAVFAALCLSGVATVKGATFLVREGAGGSYPYDT